jgi:alkanesulfonate monooxygenase SsuD/methylene tetrahydromethanopterin reductase-like flavin-dependent oxidoreductase (luciferase family)
MTLAALAAHGRTQPHPRWFPSVSILSTPSIELRRQKSQTPSDQLAVRDLSARFGWINSSAHLSSNQHTRQASGSVMLKCGGFFFPQSILEKMRDYISASGSVDREHLEADNVLGPIYKAFGERLWPLMEELILSLAA